MADGGPPPSSLPALPYRRAGALAMLRAGATSWTRRGARFLPPMGVDGSGRPVLGVQSRGVEVRWRDVEAYARVCGHGAARQVPATYPHVLALPLQLALLLDRRFPWPLPGLVHLASSVRQWQAIEAGDVLDLAVWLDRPIAHPKGQALVLGCRVGRRGVVVWEGENVYLRRGVPLPEGEPWPGEDARPDAARSSTEAWRVPADIGRRYARVSGDANPIHLHPLLARLFGFRSAIAHGMWTFARALAGLGRLPGRLQAEAEFRAPILLPAQVRLRCEQTSGPQESGHLWVVESADGERVHAVGRCAPIVEA